MNSHRAWMSTILSSAWGERCVYNPEHFMTSRIKYQSLFFKKSVEYSVICRYNNVFLKQDRNELKETTVYILDVSPLPMFCLMLIISLQHRTISNNLLGVTICDDCSDYSPIIKRMLWNVSQTASGFLEVPEPYIYRGNFLVETLE